MYVYTYTPSQPMLLLKLVLLSGHIPEDNAAADSVVRPLSELTLLYRFARLMRVIV